MKSILKTLPLILLLVLVAGCETRVFHPCAAGPACRTCHGTGSYRCASCMGRGQDRCTQCNGMGRSDCNACFGRGTRQMSQFNPNTNMIEYRNQQCTGCGGAGKGACWACNGSGMKACGSCGGDGMISCGTYTIEDR